MSLNGLTASSPTFFLMIKRAKRRKRISPVAALSLARSIARYRTWEKKERTARSLLPNTLFFYKNNVFPAQSEYSYFSGDVNHSENILVNILRL